MGEVTSGLEQRIRSWQSLAGTKNDDFAFLGNESVIEIVVVGQANLKRISRIFGIC